MTDTKSVPLLTAEMAACIVKHDETPGNPTGQYKGLSDAEHDALQALAEGRTVCVPREPTEEMLLMGQHWIDRAAAGIDDDECADRVWRAMLEAAGTNLPNNQREAHATASESTETPGRKEETLAAPTEVGAAARGEQPSATGDKPQISRGEARPK